MSVYEIFDYWKTYAERDLDAAGAMYDTGRWFYVLFMCQQAIEKLVKGLYAVYENENVPKVHNIALLVDRLKDVLPSPVSEKYYMLFETLTKHYIADRYPDYISKTGEQITKSDAEKILAETREAFTWLLTLKPQNE